MIGPANAWSPELLDELREANVNLAEPRSVGARQQPTPAFVRKRILDVPGGQPARIKLDGQILERLGATSQILPDLRDERLWRVPRLRRALAGLRDLTARHDRADPPSVPLTRTPDTLAP